MQALRWAFRMARQDARGSARRLLFFIVVTSLAVSVFATITLLRNTVESSISQERKGLLGSDAILESKAALDAIEPLLAKPEITAIARSADFRSMARFHQLQDASFVQVLALEPSFPHYGTPTVQPAGAWQALNNSGVALVDQQLLVRHQLKIGDTVQIGELRLPIAGSVTDLPGDNALRSLIAPRVYIPYVQLAETKLLSKGSWISYKRYLKFASGSTDEKWLETLALDNNLRLTTVTTQENQVSETITTAYRYLSLIAIVAAILAIIGIVSIMQSYTVTNRKAVATLRCLGASKIQILAMFLIQYFAIAVISWIVGSAMSMLLLSYLSQLLTEYYQQLAITLWQPLVLFQSFCIAIIISFSGFLLLLADWQNFDPAQALRLGADASQITQRSNNKTLLFITLASLLPYVLLSVGFDGQLLLAFFALLILLALILAIGSFIQKRLGNLQLPSAPFSLRYALRSMRRVDSLATMLLLSIGVTMLLSVAVEIIRQSFFNELDAGSNIKQANVLTFDIQTDQVERSRDIITAHSAGIIDEAPMVAMRLLSVNDVAVQELDRDKKQSERWALTREYRSSYRNKLNEGEVLLSGTLPQAITGIIPEYVPVTLEKRIAEELAVDLGDNLTFNVQGLEIKTVVSGIRKANWRKLQPNVFVLFPSGVLEGAPQMYVQTAHLGSEQAVADLQQNYAQQLPNATILDLRALAKTITEIAEKLLLAIAALAVAIIAIATICLFQSIVAARQAKVSEEKTLHALGASSKQLRCIAVIETLVLLFSATLAGSILGFGAGIAATTYLLSLPTSLDLTNIAVIVSVLLGTAIAASNVSFRKQ